MSTTLVSSFDNERLTVAARGAGLHVVPAGTGLQVDAEPAVVGRVALDAGIVLTDLRPGQQRLEDIFLSLTAGTQRERLAVSA